jgi:hypothetical protein
LLSGKIYSHTFNSIKKENHFMKRYFVAFVGLFSILLPLDSFAQNIEGSLPESGVKSPYSPLAIPTAMIPLQDSLDTLLGQGYQITTMSHDGTSEPMFTLSLKKKTVLCVLTPPNPQTDQNVPTSRCWSLTRNN